MGLFFKKLKSELTQDSGVLKCEIERIEGEIGSLVKEREHIIATAQKNPDADFASGTERKFRKINQKRIALEGELKERRELLEKLESADV